MNKQAARKIENYQKIRWLTNIAELIQIYYEYCVEYAVALLGAALSLVLIFESRDPQ
jgi:hypothetical protein